MKRLRWSAVLLGLVLAVTWAGPAQAAAHTTYDETTTTTEPVVGETTTTTEPVVGETTTTTEPVVGETTTTTEPVVGETTTTTEPVVGETTTTTEPTAGDQPCSADDGVESVSAITAETAGEHPTASVTFTIKKGCIVQLALVSFTGLLDEPGDFVDVAPDEEKDSFFGPGEHSLTVDLPSCSRFSVLLFAFPVEQSTLMGSMETQDWSFSFAKPSTGGAHTLAATQQDDQPEPTVLDAIDGTTTNCPTETTNNEVAPTTGVNVTTPIGTTPIAAEGQLPGTGANATPILIAGLVLLAGGAAALITSRRARSRQAK